jgi:hypothetical protein
MRPSDLEYFGPVKRDALDAARERSKTMGPELYDALKNLLGVFDTPIMRRRIGEDSFAKEALQIAREVSAKVEGRS